MDTSKKYMNFISLGYFCEVAQDLEKMGLRNVSSPFDWSITNFEGNIRLIENQFLDFLEYEDLEQSVEFRDHYIDTKYGFFFYHDFSKYRSLEEQLETVKEKYLRRIDRFKRNIRKPTLFIRYISNEIKNENGKSKELQWIEENSGYILRVLQKYNPENEIIYIGDDDTNSDIIKIYNVAPDENDRVSRSPIIHNEELYPIMQSFKISGQEENIRRFKRKERKKNSFIAWMINKIKSLYCKVFCRAYIHSKVYDPIK